MKLPIALRFVPFNRSYATAMLAWRYPPPYEIYNSQAADTAAAIEDLLRPDFHYWAVLDDRDEMIAFRCYGSEAQVPGGDYSEEALDLGGGLRPDLTGQGLGRHIVAAAMVYGVDRFRPPRFRTTVAAFNRRAQSVCAQLGYQKVSTFIRAADGASFDVMKRAADRPALSIPLAR